MAITGFTASTNYLSADAGANNIIWGDGTSGYGLPCTVVLWFRCGETSSSQAYLVHMDDLSSGNNSFASYLTAGVSPKATWHPRFNNNAGQTIGVTGFPEDNTWVLYGGQSASSTSHKVFLDGVEDKDNTNGQSPATGSLDGIGVGSTATGGAIAGDPTIAEFAAWNSSLTGDEWTALAAGACPLFIQPHKLIWYMPLWTPSDVKPVIGPISLSVTGSLSTADHPPIIYPLSDMAYRRSAAAAGNNLVGPLAGLGGLAGEGGLAGIHGGLAG